jgi:hypothetical protein
MSDLNDLKLKVKTCLSLMYLNHTELKYETVYSSIKDLYIYLIIIKLSLILNFKILVPNNYDYLDESNILRLSCNELVQMTKSIKNVF